MHIFRRFRAYAGFTQTDLAREMGATKAAVSTWERGTRLVRPKFAHRFLDISNAHGFKATLEDVYPQQ